MHAKELSALKPGNVVRYTTHQCLGGERTGVLIEKHDTSLGFVWVVKYIHGSETSRLYYIREARILGKVN